VTSDVYVLNVERISDPVLILLESQCVPGIVLQQSLARIYVILYRR